MGKRSIRDYDNKKLNIKKVIFFLVLAVILVLLIVWAITGLEDLNNTIKENQEKMSDSSEILEEVKTLKTIDEIIEKFGGEVKEQVEVDTYYVSKNGKEYTVYLDGEITEGNIKPWDGSEAKPAIDEAGNINIYSAQELAWVANQVIKGEKNFSGVTITLRNNIDLGARQKENGDWDGPNWKPIIGFLEQLEENTNISVDENIEVINENLKRFDGTLDGNGYTIRGMKIDNNERYQGLFGYLTGTVANLTIKNSKISAGEVAGTIVSLNEGNIMNCIVENTIIEGKEKVGALVGVSMTGSNIENCCVSESSIVNGEKQVGGLVGYINNNVTIKSCINAANVTGKEFVGGISGIAFYGTTIKNCSNFSKKIEGENYIGGLVGYSAAQIEKSQNQLLAENKGCIIGNNYVGGLVGLNYTMGDINECFNNAKIIVKGDNAGGIVGLNNSNISNCYNKGEIDATQTEKLKIGGICGQNISESFINTSYNIGKINNIEYAGGVVAVNFGTITKSFCLENCLVTKTADTEYNKTDYEVKNIIIENLGDSFKKDEQNLNSGYPILNWQ